MGGHQTDSQDVPRAAHFAKLLMESGIGRQTIWQSHRDAFQGQALDLV